MHIDDEPTGAAEAQSTTCADRDQMVRRSLLPPPPTEKADASKNQTGQASTGNRDGDGNGSDRSEHAAYTDVANYVISPRSTFGIETLIKVRAI
jgi:hypothetical protein